MISRCPQAQPSAAHGRDAGRGERRGAGGRPVGHPALHLPAAGAAGAPGAGPLPVTGLEVALLQPWGKGSSRCPNGSGFAPNVEVGGGGGTAISTN